MVEYAEAKLVEMRLHQVEDQLILECPHCGQYVYAFIHPARNRLVKECVFCHKTFEWTRKVAA